MMLMIICVALLRVVYANDFIDEPVGLKPWCALRFEETDLFTGVRIQMQTVELATPVIHTRMTFCDDGSTLRDGIDVYKPQPSVERARSPWRQKLCGVSADNGPGECFTMARLQRFVESGDVVASARPGEWIGGFFECPRGYDDDPVPCTKSNSRPVAALVVEDAGQVWRETPERRARVVREPLFMTYEGLNASSSPAGYRVQRPDRPAAPPPDWWRSVDVTEEYG